MTAPTTTSSTVTELVENARRADSKAWDELVQRYGRLVTCVAARYRMQDADRADAAQNSWLRAVERLHMLRDPERFGSWMKTITTRECLAQIQRSRRELPTETVGETESPIPGPEAVAITTEAARSIERAVAELTESPRRLIQELFYGPRPDYATVSRSMGVPVGSIGPTRGRALRTMRNSMERLGFDAGTVPLP